MGIINGKPGNLFDPQGTASRAEIAALLHRFVLLLDGDAEGDSAD
ncbi:MAG: S-layer homology domain-containing protein [Oscillospiraceae bacterium]|nr:S-layer homology domain-containing protein [Oscillospiraceae bacterium]